MRFEPGWILIGCFFFNRPSAEKKKKKITTIPRCHYRYSCGVYTTILWYLERFLKLYLVIVLCVNGPLLPFSGLPFKKVSLPLHIPLWKAKRAKYMWILTRQQHAKYAYLTLGKTALNMYIWRVFHALIFHMLNMHI